jgi:hypothetical protein
MRKKADEQTVINSFDAVRMEMDSIYSVLDRLESRLARIEYEQTVPFSHGQPTTFGKVNAILDKFNIEVAVKPAKVVPSELVVKKVSKKGKK